VGFRNPLTTLSADQITGGSLGADVVAQHLTTGVDGRRVLISSDAGLRQGVWFYTGDPDEILPGSVTEQIDDAGGSRRGALQLTSPGISPLGHVAVANVVLEAGSADGAGPSRILLDAGEVIVLGDFWVGSVHVAVGYADVGPTEADGRVWVPHTFGEIPSAAITQALGAVGGAVIPGFALVDLPNCTAANLRCRILSNTGDGLAGWSGRVAWLVMA
jgi:hypothetical protein